VNSKIILVTNPDYHHGNMMSSLLINPTADEKDAVQEWLKNNDIEMILYIYNRDQDITWLLNVVAMVDSVYFNLDNTTDIAYNYASYLISNPQVTYKSENIDFSIINRDKVYNINDYIQRQWME
jgi:hypothetical protein